MSIKVMVVDDTDHVRQMLVSMLTLDGFDVVAQARSASEAISFISEFSADVIVVDYAMPEVDGLVATRMIRSLIPKQSIIIYSAYIDDELKEAAAAAGAALCVGKVDGLQSLERSISELAFKPKS